VFRALLPACVVVIETAEACGVEALPPDEASCVANAVAKRRAEFATGRVCARRALAALGVEGWPLLPDAQRVPVWPPGVVGSITHARGYTAAAAARRGEVAGLGLDVEVASPLAPDLVDRICLAAELRRQAALPRLSGLDWPKLHFSAKEAAFKGYYPLARRMLGFHDMELEIDAAASAFVARLVARDAPAADGRRAFRGRFAWSEAHVFTAVVLD